MPFLFNENTRAGVPISYRFSYGGSEKTWGSKLMQMSDVSMKAEPLDGKFSVSELSVTISDTDGSVWGSLGHGTSCLGSSFSATMFIGGTMSEQGYGPNGTRLYRANLGDSGTYVIHSGRITDVTRRNRTVTLVSQNALAQVAELEWRFPVFNQSRPTFDFQTGSNFFFTGTKFPPAGNIVSGIASLAPFRPMFFNLENDNTKFELYAYVGTGSEDTVSNQYPTPTGRGTLGLATGFVYPGTQFYFDYDRFLFEGSYLGTYIGSIQDDETAQRYGFFGLANAESAKVSGSLYPILKTRLTTKNEAPEFIKGSYFNFQQAYLDLQGSPATLWKEMLTGCCVTPLFGTDTIEPLSYATSARNTAFQSYEQRIDPKGGKVLPFMKNLLEPLQALFSLDSQNRFRFHTYGPRNLTEVIGTIGMGEVIDSEISSRVDDKYNRVVLKYGFQFETGSFNRMVEYKGSDWSNSNDFPLELECKWITQENDANITARRLVSRFQRGMPKLRLKVPLSRVGIDVGSLVAVSDDDLSLSSRIFEVTGWRKSFAEDRTVEMDCWDGDILYRAKGYAKWEDATSLTAVVSGTSTSGWGTNGTVNNINGTFYGSQFVWF